METIRLSEEVVVPAKACRMRAVRASGPGGQNVNKVNSKVEVRIPIQLISGLTEEQYDKLNDACGNVIVSKSQRFRSQYRNRVDACEKAIALVREALVSGKTRIATCKSVEQVEARLRSKRHKGKIKANRQRSWRSELDG